MRSFAFIVLGALLFSGCSSKNVVVEDFPVGKLDKNSINNRAITRIAFGCSEEEIIKSLEREIKEYLLGASLFEDDEVGFEFLKKGSDPENISKVYIIEKKSGKKREVNLKISYIQDSTFKIEFKL